MQKKTLKVYNSTGNPTPKITLQGKWLLELGFDIGNYIEVNFVDNQMIITKVEAPEELPKVNVKTKLNKHTIDIVREQALHYNMDQNEVIEKAVLYYLKKKGVI